MTNENPGLDLSRRDLLKLSAAGVLGVSMSGWLDVLAARAAETRVQHKRCILLWMDGGPSHKDTFDLKPGSANGQDGQHHQASERVTDGRADRDPDKT